MIPMRQKRPRKAKVPPTPRPILAAVGRDEDDDVAVGVTLVRELLVDEAMVRFKS